MILAHPERYGIFEEEYERVERLHEMGVLFQCNMGSVVGKYGRDVKRQVKRIIKDGFVFCFGSDIHHARGKMEINEAKKKLAKYYDEAGLEKVLVKNPRKILKPSA